MSVKTYDIPEALTMLHSGAWLHLRFITADAARAKGGEVIELPRCRKPLKDLKATKPASTRKTNQNHNYNFTVNVQLPNKSIIKVHPVLITHINHVPVL